jgi:hypothetical protein
LKVQEEHSITVLLLKISSCRWLAIGSKERQGQALDQASLNMDGQDLQDGEQSVAVQL